MQSETSDDKSQPGTRNDVIVLRVSEIFLKGKNRHAFWRALVRNARRLLRDLEGVRVQSSYMRVAVVHPPGLRRACIDRLQRLFGMASMAPSTAVATDLDAICAAAVDTARLRPGQSFKIESKRRDKSFPMTSQEVSRHVGGEVVRHTGRPVDVHHPDQIIHVEIGEHSYVFGEIIPGPGGLPVGTAGNVGLLLSGGIDSPVAGWLAMRRGCHINPIYFHSFPYTGDKTREKVLDLARILARWQGRTSVHVVHLAAVQKTLRDHGKAELAVLLYRRMMMRAASVLAERERCKALITGENLGQVASQTLENLAVIEDAAALPVLRPLITYNKVDIVKEAQHIGTYETSILPYDDCCSLFVPRHPATRARVTDLASAEGGLDVAALAVELADRAERIVVTPD
jgi:tRNA uracil 4-sulfurtransferase